MNRKLVYILSYNLFDIENVNILFLIILKCLYLHEITDCMPTVNYKLNIIQKNGRIIKQDQSRI